MADNITTKDFLNPDEELKVKYLAQTGFFAGFTAEQLREIASEFQWQSYAKGTDVLKQGQKVPYFYVVAEGRLASLLEKEKVEALPLAVFEPGSAFGEIALLTGRPAASTFRCLEDCLLLALDSMNFALLLVRWPSLNQKLIEKLSSRLQMANDFLFEAKYKEYLRSAMQLSQYQERFLGVWGGKGITLSINAKIEEMAKKPENLLIIGENGTGRQMLAWFIHKRIFGEKAPFVAIKGSHFEQQWGQSIGNLLTLIEGGTLLIKEINLLPPEAQRDLAEKFKERTSKCLLLGTVYSEAERESLTKELQDCFPQKYLIKPLRERKRDINVIAQAVLEKLAAKHNRKVPKLDHESIRLLLSHNYRQQNMTELIQIIERAFALTKGDVISIEHIFFGPTAQRTGKAINLLAWSPLKKLLQKGLFVSALQGITAGLLIFLILLFLVRPDLPFTLAVLPFVWGLWWPALVILSPLIGRVWCTVCPFASIMNFFQKYLHWDRPVPTFLKKYDYLVISFLFLLVFWVEIITEMRQNPLKTGLLLLTLLAGAIIFGLIFSRHTWCKNICPLGGLVGTASIGSILEIRSDPNICLNKCTTLDCYVGTTETKGCPMFQHLPYLDNNLDCKLCFNCVRNCPNDSVQLNLRFPAREVWHLVRVNQGFVIFVGVSLAMLLPVIYFESVRADWPVTAWRLYFSIAYWASAVLAGILTWFLAKPYKTKAASNRIKLTYALIPLVLAGHVMYQLNYLPGLDRFTVGLLVESAPGQMATWYVPLTQVVQILALLIGLLLTAFTAFMVWQTAHKKTGARQEAPNVSK